jgi:uroporphyrinogen decarboxylase
MRPDIQQLLITLRGGKGQYTPIAELGIHPLIKEQIIGRPIVTLADDIEFWHKAGYDYIKLQPGVNFNPAGIGADKNLMEYREGTLVRKWASESNGVITSAEELERYVFPSPSDFDYSNFEKVKDLLPEGMGVIGQYGDIFTMTWEMMGFENFSFAMFENPELVIELNTKLGNLVYSMYEYFVQSPVVDAIWYSDDIAYTNGLLVSPDVLDIVFFPWLKKIGELCRKYNKPFIYHTDGILYDIMDNILDCGVNALHPIEPKSMIIKEVKERYGDKLCLIGNVDVDILSRGNPEDIKKYVRKNIEEIGYNGGYCVGSGNSVPEYVDINNYRAMIGEALK